MSEVFDDLTPWSPAEVEQMENALGNPIPADLRQFLLEHGSGHFSMRVVPVSDENGFFGSIHPFDTVMWARDDRPGANLPLPDAWLAIGSGAGGQMCVQADDHAHGTVMWADEDLAEALGVFDDEEDTNVDLEEYTFKVADSWDEMLTMAAGWDII